MDAVTYLKDFWRLCGKYDCFRDDCPLTDEDDCLSDTYPEKAVAIVENWAKEHPQKTYKDVFLEKFPNNKLFEDGCPNPCVVGMFGGECTYRHGKNDVQSCSDCWNRPYEETE